MILVANRLLERKTLNSDQNANTGCAFIGARAAASVRIAQSYVHTQDHFQIKYQFLVVSIRCHPVGHALQHCSVGSGKCFFSSVFWFVM